MMKLIGIAYKDKVLYIGFWFVVFEIEAKVRGEK